MVTLQDIARAAQISYTTVSLVLNGKGEKYRIAAETQEKVRETAKKMGYIPNVNARRLVSGSEAVYEIAVLWPGRNGSEFLSEIVDMVNEMMEQHEISDWRISIYPFRDGQLQHLRPLLESRQYNGLITYVSREEDIAFLQSMDIQAPLVNVFTEILPYSSVIVDGQDNGRLACDVFHELGRKHALVIGCGKRSTFFKNRKLGFIKRADELGMEWHFRIAKVGDETGNAFAISYYWKGRQAIRELLLEGIETDAVFAQDDALAYGIIDELREAGLRVPEDVAVIGYGDTDHQNDAPMRVAMIEYQVEAVCRAALRLLEEHLTGKEGAETICLPSKIAYGEGCPEPVKGSAEEN